MKILVDLDSTITNFAEVLLAELNKENGTNYAYHEIDHWDWFRENFFDPWEPIRYAEFWDKVQPYPNVVETMEKLRREGNEIYIVTASFFIPSLSRKINTTLSWFNPWFVDESSIIVTKHKDLINGDILIDDGLHNCEAFPNKVLLYDQPWNRSADWTLRVHNWQEIDETLHKNFLNN